MDAVMKLLQDLERQQNAPVVKPERGGKKGKRKKQVEAAPQEPILTPPPPASPSEPIVAAQPTQGWDRQRLLDAFRIAQALGPPPGLDDF